LLFLDWYSVEGSIDIGFGDFSLNAGASAGFNAWDGQGFVGTLANLVILAAGLVAVGLALVTATSSTVALPVATGAVTTAGGASATLMILLRMLFQPDIEVPLIHVSVSTSLRFGIFLALGGALATTYGGWQSMQERPARGQ
jgi:hypothetical protein